MRKSTCFVFFVIATLVVLLLPGSRAWANVSLTAVPITWNVVGLDSNNVNVGPNNFPVGMRVCNTGTSPATNVTASFIWESSDPYINLRPGSLNPLLVSSLGAGQCSDFYFELSVTRSSAAYDHTRRYHIDISADGGISLSSPQPREVYVEHLVSQNRNATTDMQLNGVSIPPGGAMALVVGQTYNIKLIGFTATNGYEQLETFINFPNTIFRINSVSTTFTANAGTDPLAGTKLYANGCGWENDPNSPNYRSCLSTGKYGGDITVTYNVTIIGGGGTNQTLSALIYDFSGSSYHYNADYSASARVAAIIDPSTLTISKSFFPDPAYIGGISRLSFTVTNPNGGAVGDVSFSDTLPSSPGTMHIASSANVSSAGCGTPSVTAVPGTATISASNITVGPNGTCTIGVDVDVPVAGTYTNTSDHLFVGSADTGRYATDTLTVNTEPPPPPPPTTCPTPVSFATWAMPTSGQGSGGPPPPYSLKAGDVSLANASAGMTPSGTQSISTSGNPANSWQIQDAWPTTTGPPGANNPPYFQFQVDTTNYGGITISFDYDLEAPGDWASGNNNHIYVYASQDGTTFSLAGTITATKGSWQSGSSVSTTLTGGTTWFRITADSRNPTKPTAIVRLDNVVFQGCQRANLTPLTLSKLFSPNPIAVNGTSTLTFTLTNPNSGYALSGASFTDALPAGVQVATVPAPTNSCGGTVTGATAGSTSISLSGGTIPGGGSCTLSVNVTATASGPHPNISGFISSTETGINAGPGGAGSATLTALMPPTMEKVFSPNPMVSGGVSALVFSITNANPDHPLTGVAFSDALPGGLVVANPTNASSSGCGSPTFGPVAGDTSIMFSSGTIAAGGTCSVSVNVTTPTAGVYVNTTGPVTADITGGSDTASDTLTVLPPSPRLGFMKQIATSAGGPWRTFVAVAAGDNIYYRFTVENVGDVMLNNASVTDPDLDLSTCSWQDGDGNPLTAPFALPVADADDGHIAYCVVGPVTAQAGWHTNTATADSDDTNGLTDTATYATVSLTLDKSALESSFTSEGELIHYQYLVTNGGAVPLQGPVTVTDNKAATTCPALSTVGNGDNVFDPGESVTCTAVYTVTAGDVSAGSLTNTAYATVQSFNSNTDVLTILSSTSNPALNVIKEVSADNISWSDTLAVGAGVPVYFRVRVQNTGNVRLTGLTVDDGMAGCALTRAADDPGDNDFDFEPTETWVFTCSVTAVAGTHTNTATVASDQTAAVTDTATYAMVALTLDKTSTETTFGSIGDLIHYQYLVTNSGYVSLLGPASVTDDKTPVTCPAVNTVGNNDNYLDPSESIMCTATYAVTAGDMAAGYVTNQAFAVVGSFNSNTDSTTVRYVAATPALSIVKEVSSSAVGPWSDLVTVVVGNPVFFRIRVANTGDITLTGLTVDDGMPGCTLLRGADDPGDNDSDFEAGETWVYTCSVTAETGTNTNTATASSAETAPRTDDAQYFGAAPAIAIDKNSTTTKITGAGQVVPYTLTVTNTGNVTLTGITVSDPNCDTAPGYQAGDADGDGRLDLSEAWTYTCSHSVTQAEVGAGGTLDNTATADSNESGSASDSHSIPITPEADLAVMKNDGQTQYVPGGTLTYTIVVTNSGPANVSGATVSDPRPVQIASWTWTCAVTGGATCAGSGGLITTGFTDTAGMPAGSTITYTVTASIDPGATGDLVNTVHLTMPSGVTDPDPTDNSATDTDTTAGAQADLSVSKTDGQTQYVPGGTLTYTVVVTNSGPGDVSGVTVSDVKPVQIANWSWTCVTAGGATCAGSGGLVATGFSALVSMPANSSITYTVVANVDPGAAGDLTNTVTVSHPADSTPNNNSASDTDQPILEADLVVTKTNGTDTYTPGGTLIYTITVTNLGPASVTGATVTDILPVEIASASWSCAPSGGASCTASGSGNINDTVNLPVGATVTYTVATTVGNNAAGALINLASAKLPANFTDPTPNNNSSTDADQPLAVAIPTLDFWGFLLLICLVLMWGFLSLRRAPQTV